MAAAFFTTYPGPYRAEYTKEEFMDLMAANGIKCENCKHYTWYTNWPAGEGECQHLQTSYQEHDLQVSSNFFCASFNPKSNG